MSLPVPFYEDAECGITIYHGDCREILPWLEPGSVDAVVTDPPYGIGYMHNGGVRGDKAAVGQTAAANRRGPVPVVGDDAQFDPAPWLVFDNVLMWGADHYCGLLPSGRGTWLAWDKAVDNRAPADSFVDVEFAWTSAKVKRNVFRFLWKGLACEKVGESNGRRWHPTQKPIHLMRWCLGLFPSAATILDPFMGSASTLVAAKQLGRRAIGIEIEERYCEIAVNRLRQKVFQFDTGNDQ